MKKIISAFLLTIVYVYPLAAQSTFSEFADSAETWYNTRVENAKKGVKEKIEMPVMVHSMAWGCTCPDYFMGTESNHTELYLSPVAAKGLPVSDSEVDRSLIVTGYFTGKMEKFFGDDSVVSYVPFFKITSWKQNNDGDSADAPSVIK